MGSDTQLVLPVLELQRDFTPASAIQVTVVRENSHHHTLRIMSINAMLRGITAHLFSWQW